MRIGRILLAREGGEIFMRGAVRHKAFILVGKDEGGEVWFKITDNHENMGEMIAGELGKNILLAVQMTPPTDKAVKILTRCVLSAIKEMCAKASSS